MSATSEDMSVDGKVNTTPATSNDKTCKVLSKGLAWNFCSIALNPFMQCYARSAKLNPISIAFKEFAGMGKAICDFTLKHSVLSKAPPTYIFNIVFPVRHRSP
ncbi:hypothetical protein AC1031_000303 [Aphanomyces cochlioides]|nr:hypothetical protein AC1031_000303 [Aphanomyces cochlioides]